MFWNYNTTHQTTNNRFGITTQHTKRLRNVLESKHNTPNALENVLELQHNTPNA